jgi:hypothetical protein
MSKFIQILSVVISTSLLSACGLEDQISGNNTTTKAAGYSATTQNNASRDSVNLSWTPPSTRTDGSYLPLTELSGYRVYMGRSSTDLTPLVDLDDDSSTQHTVGDLPAGDYYFSISVFDIDGQESSHSQVIMIHLG